LLNAALPASCNRLTGSSALIHRFN